MIRPTLLDTDIASEILKGMDPVVLGHATAYAAVIGRFTFTAVTVLEVLYGLHHRDAHRRLQVAERIFAENDVVVPTLDDYRTAGRIRGVARGQGRQLTSDDCLIGAVAQRLGLPVATGNTGHFVAMRRAGLAIDLIDWRQS